MIAFVLFILATFSFAAHQDLPRGGDLNFNALHWDALENKTLNGIKTVIISNKNHKELIGYVLDGSIKNLSKCPGKQQGKWSVCQESHSMDKVVSYQIYMQRQLGKETFQTYIVSFNFPKEKQNLYAPLLDSFFKDLSKP